jgi:hypothetical protein
MLAAGRARIISRSLRAPLGRGWLMPAKRLDSERGANLTARKRLSRNFH